MSIPYGNDYPDEPWVDRDGTPMPETPSLAEEETKAPRRSVAAQLVDLARAKYALGVTDTDDPFGVKHDRQHLALMLRGGRTGLRAELARQFFAQSDTVPSQQALSDACTVLEGFAAQQQPQRVYLRVADTRSAVYVDMGDTAGRVIEISQGNWRIIDNAPVLFRRTKLTGELPHPHSGDLSALWEFVGVDDGDQPLILAVLVSTLIQVDVPHVILALLAEQGSAKSTVTRFLVSLIDSSAVPLRQPPRDPDGWTTAASASWVVALDNLSGVLSGWLSDCLCRASTGDGSVKRALYTDSDVAVTAFRRCGIINGVDLVIDRGDLAERVVAVDLRRVRTRRPEDELSASWEDARPGIFGALLDLAATVHNRLSAIEVEGELPRMADFAKVLQGVDDELGTAGLQRYRERSALAAAETLDAPFIAELVAAKTQFTDRTSAELLSTLTPHHPDWRSPRGWPKNARAVTGLLTRHAPALRARGWDIDNDQGQNKEGVTKWIIRPPEGDGGQSPPDPPDPSTQVNGQKSGGSDELALPATSPPNPLAGNAAGQAGQAKSADPPYNHLLTSANGAAGQAGQQIGTSPVPSTAVTDAAPCPCGRPAPVNSNTGLCHWCAVKASKFPAVNL
jgi:hypothetical protein